MKNKTIILTSSLALVLLGALPPTPAQAKTAEPPGTQNSKQTTNPAGDAARADIARTLGFVPQFFLKFPEGILPGAWDEMKSLQLNPSTALPGRSKELIGLAVAAQVPCRYCIVAHTEFARLNGASDSEIGEAVAMAALTRHWSTYLNGIQTDEAKFRAEIAKIVSNVKQASASKAAPAKPISVVDGQTALAEITQSLGYAPEFLKRFPDVARAGAWRQMRDVQLNPATASSGKTKELMGLAVASQIPCRFCVIAHTEFAKLNGASEAEVNEAIAMASLTRDLSTLLNGMQVDEPQFRKDVDRIVKGATAAAAAASKKKAQASR
ncbi:MAG: carboxymuconolactone decarboxylase family protein [Myxococcales bacterium]